MVATPGCVGGKAAAGVMASSLSAPVGEEGLVAWEEVDGEVCSSVQPERLKGWSPMALNKVGKDRKWCVPACGLR